MIEIRPLSTRSGTAIGVEIENPEAPERPAVIVVIAKRGLLVCGNFDIEELEKRNITAAKIVGLTKIEDALQRNVVAVTSRAKALGIDVGMSGSEAIEKMNV
ncbi:MAG: DUF1805 domain-containing protein [Candidatus Verstraetearchaeota archaeon]|nr:DUF1805 domain-containing protein [Candidatus Verstraetearchaeota archaeon]